MIGHLPPLRFPRLRRNRPATGPQTVASASIPVQSPDWWASVQPGLRRRLLASRIPRCWACGREGASFCPNACEPRTSKADPGPWRPAEPIPFVPRVEVPDDTEQAADARIAAVLDQEAAA